MKNQVELRYIAIFIFSLLVILISLFVSINKLQSLLLQQMLTSCTAVYQSITTNSVIISGTLILGLLAVLLSLSLKLVLSSYRTSQRMAVLAGSAQKKLPLFLSQSIAELGLNQQDFIVTSHQSPVALTVGLVRPKVILSRGLIKQLSKKELEAVLLHEVYHQKNKHGMLYVVAEAITAALAMLVPILKDVVQNMKLDFENAADGYAVVYQGSPRYITNALGKLSDSTVPTDVPAFAGVADKRLLFSQGTRVRARSFSKAKLCFSLATVMVLSFFAAAPFGYSKETVSAEQSGNVCIRRVDMGMSRFQNSTSILPATVF